jgi:hypothetical protein
VTSVATGKAVTDPSCTPTTGQMTGATGATQAYTITASSSAVLGSYTVSVTSTDLTTNVLSQTTPAPVAVYVVASSSPVFLAKGASGIVAITFNTATPSSGTAPTSLVSFACGSIYNISTKAITSSTGYITCSGSTTTVTGNQTTAEVTMALNTTSTTAMLKNESTVRLAAIVGVPLLMMLGMVTGWKKQRKNFLRYLGMVLLMIAASYAATGCGGNFTRTATTTTGTLAVGSYDVQVIATDQAGGKYYAVVPLTVNASSVN